VDDQFPGDGSAVNISAPQDEEARFCEHALGGMSAEMTYWCVHEHGDKERICLLCVAIVCRLLVEGAILCRKCMECSDPHPCQFRMTVQWDGGDLMILQEAE
jgi:hypothetical protein